MHCAGLLLTGGASRRLGSDKAALRLVPGADTLAERAGRLLASVAGPALEVGPARSGLPAVEEPAGHHGPLVALAHGVAGLRAVGVDSGGVVVLACDMPLVGERLLRWLVEHPARGTVIPRSGPDGRAQPLCARWALADLAAAADLVAAGDRALQALLRRSDPTFVDDSDWLPYAGPAGLAAFDDIDTPDALARVRRLWDRAGS